MILTATEIFYPLLHLSSAAFQDSEEISISAIGGGIIQPGYHKYLIFV